MKLILLFLCLITYSINIQMTSVKRNRKEKLPVTSDDKYFYLTVSDYNYPSYIYFCLEDDDFDLKYNYIKGCYVKDYPGTNPQTSVDSCSSYFSTISYDSSYTTSSSKKYYYKIPYKSYNYAIISYSGYHNYGNLYVTSDNTNLFLNDAADALSTVAIVFIVIGSIIVIAVAIVISACCCACCACCRRSQPGIMPITQPSAYVAPNPVAYGAAIPLQASPVTYSPY